MLSGAEEVDMASSVDRATPAQAVLALASGDREPALGGSAWRFHLGAGTGMPDQRRICNTRIFELGTKINLIRFVIGSIRFYLFYLEFRAYVGNQIKYLAIK